jgi:hypothetical protein
MAADGAEVLENGYAATTPPGDNVTNEFVRDQAESWAAHAYAAGRTVELDGGLGALLVDNQSPTLFLNPVWLLQPLAAGDAAALAARAASFYGARDGGMYAIWSAWPTPDLREHGLVLSGHPPLMLREPGGMVPAPPSDLRIERVHDAHTAAAYETTLIDGFPIHDLQPAQPGTFFEGDVMNAPGWHHYVGFVDDVPVATASAYVGPHVLRVDNVATLPDRRGRGYGAALTWQATLTQPELPALLLASDDGRPIYERMGYRSISRSTLWLGPRTRG